MIAIGRRAAIRDNGMVWQCSSQVEEPVMCKLPSVHISSYRQVSKPATVITATLGHPCYTLLALKLNGLVFCLSQMIQT